MPHRCQRPLPLRRVALCAAVVAAYSDPEYLKQLADAGVPAPAAVGFEDVKERKDNLKALLSDEKIRAAIENAIAANMK